MVRHLLGFWFAIGAISCLFGCEVEQAFGQQKEQGAYVLVDIRRDFSEFDKDPETYRVLSSSDNHCKVALTSIHQGKWVCSRVMLHTWNTPPTVLRPGATVNFELFVANRLLKGEWDMHVGDRTAIRIDTDIGGPLWSNDMVERPVKISGQVNHGYPAATEVKDSIPWKVSNARQFKTLTLRYSFVGDGKGKIDYDYQWQDNPQPKVTPKAADPKELTLDDVSTPVSADPFAGTWQHGSGGETWTFTPSGDGKYTAVEKGFANGTGTAVRDGNKLHVDYKTPGGVEGKYDITLNPDGKSGVGKWSDSSPDGGTRDFTRLSGTGAGPAAPPGTNLAGFTVKVAKVQAKPGETVLVPVELLNPQEVSSLNIELAYSSAVASVKTQPTAGDLKGNRLFEANPAEAGVVLVGLAGAEPLRGNGQLALLPFTAVGKPGDKTALSVKVTSANRADGQPVSAAVVNGELVITGKMPGDVDGSGTLDPRDALEALKMSVRLLPVDLAADMDGNGVITANDARLILLKAVGK